MFNWKLLLISVAYVYPLRADGPHDDYAFEKSRVFLNGKELTPQARIPADYRTMSIYEGVDLKKEWNHVLIKIARDRAEGSEPASLAVRIGSNNEEFQSQLETAVQPPR